MADSEPRGTEGGWAEHDRAQRRAWLALSFRARLEWLWQAKQFAARAAKAALHRARPNRAGGSDR